MTLRRLHPLELGDVLAGAEHPHRASRLVALELALGAEHPDFAVRADAAVVVVEGLLVGEGLLDDPVDIVTVVVVDALEKGLVAELELLRIETVDAIELIGPANG